MKAYKIPGFAENYKNGKMYMPAGSSYKVSFRLENKDLLEFKMTIDGTPYTEIWKRTRNK